MSQAVFDALTDQQQQDLRLFAERLANKIEASTWLRRRRLLIFGHATFWIVCSLHLWRTTW